MPNSLAREARRKIGLTALDTLFKHYLNRVKKGKAVKDTPFTQLRRDDLLYDERFNVVKTFFEVAAHHTVEELQAFSQVGVLSPSWVHVEQVTVPMSCCNEAATLLIQALGGEEHTSRLVGGTKWWQVRDIAGIPGEWVAAKKDWEEVEERRRTFQKEKADHNDSSKDAANNLPSSSSEPSNIHDGDVDKFCCILFSHGGGYFFGSLDQERHCAQRFARMTKGRVFSVNYRLAPQYPFPCALQDLVAAYLYLIQPPPDATHQPVKPSRIVVAGGTAGGGLTLALLQVLRDTGRPLPAGSILISPWCDLTHSFPSIHTNTATDVFPSFGLALHKPSALWPPPSEEMAHKIHDWLRQRDRQIANETLALEPAQHALGVDVTATATLPPVDEKKNQTVVLETKSGETLKIETQVQLYTQHHLIVHPLVSPVLSYLGGLPPLFIIAGDKEALRDEILYLAHKAADPSRFLLKDGARSLYPPLVGIEDRYGPTQVHLQVYDDAACLLPIIFPLTTLAKFCYRAMATFAKHVTGKPSEVVASAPHRLLSSPANEDLPSGAPVHHAPHKFSGDIVCDLPGAQSGLGSTPDTPAAIPDSSNICPSFSWSNFCSFLRVAAQASMSGSTSERSPRQGESNLLRSTEVRLAGDPSVYYNKEGLLLWKEGMIRERISIQGEIGLLEPADKLDALLLPPAAIGKASEENMRQYLDEKALFDRKYARVSLKIERERNRDIDHAGTNITRILAQLQVLQDGQAPGKQKETPQVLRDELESLIATRGWAWADERPPPSSILYRRDMVESHRLACVADQSVLQDEPDMNGNSLWAVIMNFFATFPPRECRGE